jgi:hypothetical protein
MHTNLGCDHSVIYDTVLGFKFILYLCLIGPLEKKHIHSGKGAAALGMLSLVYHGI